jgi:hypothetical protein
VEQTSVGRFAVQLLEGATKEPGKVCQNAALGRKLETSEYDVKVTTTRPRCFGISNISAPSKQDGCTVAERPLLHDIVSVCLQMVE